MKKTVPQLLSTKLNPLNKLLIVIILIIGSSFSAIGQVSNYAFTESTNESYTEIIGGSTLVAPGVTFSNAVSSSISLGFSFNFNGSNKTSVFIAENGFVTFDVAPTSSNGALPISSTDGYSGSIACYGANLHNASAINAYNSAGILSEVRYQTLGVSPNRVFVVQYKNVIRRTGSTSFTNRDGLMNMQIRIYEGTNIIETWYKNGFTSTNSTSVSGQVGLRGALNTDFNNRKNLTGTPIWPPTAAGTANTNYLNTSSTLYNNSVVKFTFTPPCFKPTALLNQTFCNKATIADLIVSGQNVKWYDSENDNTSLSINTALTNGQVVYASQSFNGCESLRIPIIVSINNPQVTTNLSKVCAGSSVEIKAISSVPNASYLWSSGENTATINPTISVDTAYWVDMISEGVSCRKEFTIEVTPNLMPTFDIVEPICYGNTFEILPTISNNGISGTWSPELNNTLTTNYTFTPSKEACAIPFSQTLKVINVAAPSGNTTQTFCNKATIADLIVSGQNIKYYHSENDNTSLPINTALTNGQVVYASQSFNGCESLRIPIIVSINNPQVTTNLSKVCAGSSVEINAISSVPNASYLWSSGENTATINPTLSVDTSYWVDIISESVSCRKEFTIEVTPNLMPTFDVVEPICYGNTFEILPTISNNGISGTWSPELNNTLTTSYTFTPSKEACAVPFSQTLEVINSAAPSGNTTQTFCNRATISNLVVTGENIKWYDSENGGIPIDPSAELISETSYFASQTSGICESNDRLEVGVIIQQISSSIVPAAETSIWCGGTTNLSATSGDNTIRWYDAETQETLLGTSQSGANFNVAPLATTTYYAESYNGTCANPERAAVTVNVSELPAPTETVGSPEALTCGGSTNLSSQGNGNQIYWYDAPTGGNLVGNTTNGAALNVTPTRTTTYYAEAISRQTGVDTYAYTGNQQTWTVPSGIYSIDVDAYGAQGGTVSSTGGKGGHVQSTLSVTPGQTLNLFVGGQGQTYSPGWNGGGYGSGYYSNDNGGGGGASDIRIDGTNITDRVLVAGGGGGAGAWCRNCNGGDGGGSSSAGNGFYYSYYYPYYAGGGASLTSGGQGAYYGGQGGSLAQGGNADYYYSAGGGGGGYYGGGGGGYYGGGGGGSSWIIPTGSSNIVHSQGVQTGNGQIKISYISSILCYSTTRTPVTITVVPPVAPNSVSAAEATIWCGGTTNLTATSTDSTIRWYDAENQGTLLGTTQSGANFNVAPLATTTYYAESYNGTCANPQRVAVTVTVNELPAPRETVATPETLTCGGSTHLSSQGNGNQINWYDAPTGGNLVGITTNGAALNVTPISTTTYYAEAVSRLIGTETILCFSTTRTPVTITVVPPIAPTVSAEATIWCGGTTNLSATSADNSIRWYDTATQGTLLGTSQSGANFNVAPLATTTYYAESYNGTCANLERVAVTVTVSELPAPTETVGSPETLTCGGSSNLSSQGNGNQVYWYDAPTGGNLVGTTTNGAALNVTPSRTTTYYVEAISRQAGVDTFSFTGNQQTWTVPSGIYSIDIDAYGAQGGTVYSTGGKGGRVQSTLSVTPGQTLNLFVGGQGQTYSPGWNGGGYGSGYYSWASGGGGGASDIRINGANITDRVLVAGGGGGAGAWNGNTNGGDGGGSSSAGNGFYYNYYETAYAGGGASQNSGGQGAYYGGQGGSLAQGGNANHYYYAGGGGGGYFGGGGGANYGGGGGGSSWIIPTGSSNIVHSQGVQTGNGQIKISYISPILCSSTTRTPVTITVVPPSVASVITGAAKMCSGANITLTYGSGSVGTIQWQYSLTSSTDGFSDIEGENNLTYTATNLQESTWFRVVNTSGVCSPAYSEAVQVVVNAPVVSGFIEVNNTYVCSKSNSTDINLNFYEGEIQWQQASSLNGVFTDIVSANTAIYKAINLEETTYFRAKVSSASGACASQVSDSVGIIVEQPAASKLITGASPVCIGSDTTLTCGTGSVGTIQWQSSTTSSNEDFYDISNENELVYNANDLQQTTWFRVMNTVRSCSSVYSTAVEVVVQNPAIAGNIEGGNVDVCKTLNTTNLVLNNYDGMIQWQKAIDINGPYITIPLASLPNYTVTGLAITSYFRALVSSGLCYEEVTEPVAINVVSILDVPSVVHLDLCYKEVVTALTAVPNKGCTLKWYDSSTNKTPLLSAPIPSTGTIGYKSYYVSQENGCLESPRIPLTVRVVALPTTPSALKASDALLCKYIGTINEVTYTATAANATSFAWTVPDGVTIVSGDQTTNTLVVNFSKVKLGNANEIIGNITVRAINSTGCYSTARAIVLSSALPTIPSTLVLTNGSAKITTVSPYIGKEIPLTLTANSVTAGSFEWILPRGVNVTSSVSSMNVGDNGITVVRASGVITINFKDVPAGAGSLIIGVKSVGGCGISDEKKLSLNRTLPATPGTISTTNTDICNSIVGTSTIVTYTIAPVLDSFADGYLWSVPNGAVIITPFTNNSTRTYGTSIDVVYTSYEIAGLVSVKASNGVGHSVTPRVLSIARKAPPVIAYFTGPTSFCTNGTVSLSVPVATVNPYRWTATNGALVNTKTTSVSFSGVTAQTVSISVKAENACLLSSATKTLVLKKGSCSNAKEINSSPPNIFKVLAYPNPTSSTFEVTTSTEKGFELKVFDVLGRLIEERSTRDATMEIGGDYPSGTYNILVNQGENLKSVRVIKR